jgi:hypothetical protein
LPYLSHWVLDDKSFIRNSSLEQFGKIEMIKNQTGKNKEKDLKNKEKGRPNGSACS